MNSALMFSKASDLWTTPDDTWRELHQEFYFTLDAAATSDSCKVMRWMGPDHELEFMRDALVLDWKNRTSWPHAIWLNPPYSKCREFMLKAAKEAIRGATVVCLVPSRTDTKWWHDVVWDAEKHQPRPGVEVRFLKGRLRFGNSKNSAPFPSVIVVFRPLTATAQA